MLVGGARRANEESGYSLALTAGVDGVMPINKRVAVVPSLRYSHAFHGESALQFGLGSNTSRLGSRSGSALDASGEEDVMRGLVGLSILALAALSLGWTSWKTRRALRKSLGRESRAGEDTSLRTWMSLPSDSLDAAAKEVDANPFQSVLDTMGSKADMGRRPNDPPTLK